MNTYEKAAVLADAIPSLRWSFVEPAAGMYFVQATFEHDGDRCEFSEPLFGRVDREQARYQLIERVLAFLHRTT